MILTLHAVSLNDQPLTRPISARFDAAGGSIGRADHSTLALPDPERFISRKQAEIVFVNGRFLVRNVGAANPINLGSRVLAGGESAALSDGDEVRIGGYLLRVECQAQTAPAPNPPASVERLVRTAAPPLVSQAQPRAEPPSPPRSEPRAPQRLEPLSQPRSLPRSLPHSEPRSPSLAAPAPAVSGNPFADLLGGADDQLANSAPAPAMGAADPFADLLATPPAFTAPPRAQAQPRKPSAFDDLLPPAAGLSAAAVAPPTAAAPRLPDDFDPFAAAPSRPAASPRSSSGQSGRIDDDLFADLAPVAPPASIDHQFGLGPGGGNDPLKDFEFGLGGTPAASPAGLPSSDPLAMFDSPGLSSSPSRSDGAPMQDNLAGVHAGFEPPRRVASTGAPVAPRAAMASRSDEAALWQAFCEGAGIQVALPADPAQAAQQLQQIGLMLRAAVAGTRELMAVRASTKYEMRAAVTQIQARSNNPLKFAPDVRTGLEQLVQPAARGFLEGPEAMDDAMRDLVGHSIGTVAGMRAAIEGMLERFDPATLEQTLGAGSMLDSLVPLKRNARLWELYLQRFKAIREEAQEDFHALFGKAFVAAYEQQVARLKQGGKG